MTYMDDMTARQLREEVSRRINGGHEMGHGLTNREFYALLPAKADLTGEEWATLRRVLVEEHPD